MFHNTDIDWVQSRILFECMHYEKNLPPTRLFLEEKYAILILGGIRYGILGAQPPLIVFWFTSTGRLGVKSNQLF